MKTPERTPPKMMTMSRMPGTAETRKSCQRREAGERLGRVAAAHGDDIGRDHQGGASSRPGTMPAVNRSAIEIVPPAAIE